MATIIARYRLWAAIRNLGRHDHIIDAVGAQADARRGDTAALRTRADGVYFAAGEVGVDPRDRAEWVAAADALVRAANAIDAARGV